MDYVPLTYENYIYPVWANVLGWMIAMSSVCMIPGMAVYQLCITPGTFSEVILLNRYLDNNSTMHFFQRLKYLCTPWRDQQALAVNGIQTDSVQIKMISTPPLAEEV